MTTRATVTIPTTEPCPPWCQEPAGHPYVQDLGQVERWHRASFGEVEVSQLDVFAIDAEGVRISTVGAEVSIRDRNRQVVDLLPSELAALLPDLRRALSLLA